jgi:hypothetical protein
MIRCQIVQFRNDKETVVLYINLADEESFDALSTFLFMQGHGLRLEEIG